MCNRLHQGCLYIHRTASTGAGWQKLHKYRVTQIQCIQSCKNYTEQEFLTNEMSPVAKKSFKNSMYPELQKYHIYISSSFNEIVLIDSWIFLELQKLHLSIATKIQWMQSFNISIYQVQQKLHVSRVARTPHI